MSKTDTRIHDPRLKPLWHERARMRCLIPTSIACAGVSGYNTSADPVSDFGSWVLEGWGYIVTQVMYWWVNDDQYPVGDCTKPTADSCVEAVGAVGKLQAHTAWITGAVAVGAVLFAVIKIAIERRGQAAADVTRGMITLLFTVALGLGIIQVSILISDRYSEWIIESAADGDVSGVIGTGTVATSGIAAVLAMIVGIIVSLFQWIIMLGRDATVIILSGGLPVAAAMGMTGRGKVMRDKYFNWLIAWTLYKPVAATIYAGTLWIVGDLGKDNQEGLGPLLVGAAGQVIALGALPAVMKIVSSMTADAAGGDRSIGGLVGMAGTQLASGAINSAMSNTRQGSSSGDEVGGSPTGADQSSQAPERPRDDGASPPEGAPAPTPGDHSSSEGADPSTSAPDGTDTPTPAEGAETATDAGVSGTGEPIATVATKGAEEIKELGDNIPPGAGGGANT